MFKDILVPLIDVYADAIALDAAISLARASGGRVAALIVVPLFVPPAFEFGAIPTEIYAGLHDEARRHGRELADATRARYRELDVPLEIRVVETELLPTARVAALHACYSDLVLVATPLVATPNDDARRDTAESVFLEVLLNSGRPVLRVPESTARASIPPRRIVVAWQPTREASRAVHDALPLLRGAKQIELVTVAPVVGESRHGEVPGADIAAHLARHGCRVDVVRLPRAGESAGDVVLAYAASTKADMIVSGGFGHSRLREQWLGGFTRTICESATIPVLFSH